MEPEYPQPRYRNKRRFWALSEVVNYERAEAGLPPIEFDPADERWLSAAQMRERYGVSAETQPGFQAGGSVNDGRNKKRGRAFRSAALADVISSANLIGTSTPRKSPSR